MYRAANERLEIRAGEPKYLYNGKDLESEFGLDWYAYGARYYDPTLGRFTGVDPISDEFPHVSTYNYAENEPIANIDLHGLQSFPVRFLFMRGVDWGKEKWNSSKGESSFAISEGSTPPLNDNLAEASMGGRFIGGSAYNKTEPSAIALYPPSGPHIAYSLNFSKSCWSMR